MKVVNMIDRLGVANKVVIILIKLSNLNQLSQ